MAVSLQREGWPCLQVDNQGGFGGASGTVNMAACKGLQRILSSLLQLLCQSLSIILLEKLSVTFSLVLLPFRISLPSCFECVRLSGLILLLIVPCIGFVSMSQALSFCISVLIS